MSLRHSIAVSRVVPFVLAAAMLVAVLVLPSDAQAASAIRINTGGPAQTVGGVQWLGCTSSCNGYVKGGNAWSGSERPISDVQAPDSQTIERTEWTGGETSGVDYGKTAFTFTIPADNSVSYRVHLHFTELNKTAAGQRVFDVRINGATVLGDFDIFQQAGGANKALVRTFDATPANGKIVIDFVRKVQNAKISAIQVIPTGSTPTTQPPNGGDTLSWNTIANSPTKTLEAAGGALGDKLYYFGGYLPTYLPMTNSYSYSPESNSWTRLPDMPRALTHVATAVDGRSFVFAGGYGAVNGQQIFAVNDVYRYNVDTKQWSTLPDLPAARGSGGMALVGRTLHFMGGVDGSRKERSEHWTLDLDNVSAGWKTAPTFPYPRTHFAVVAVGSDLYTVGGLNGIDAKSTAKSGIYRYDTITKKWDSAVTTSIPKPLSHVTSSTFVYDGRIWIVTGELKFANGTASVWSYDLATKQWRTETSAPTTRNAAVAGQINGSIYLVTGTLRNAVAYKATLN